MDMKCPHCDKGCEKCNHTGILEEARFATGRLYDMICESCGESIGGGIFKQQPKDHHSPCVWCKVGVVKYIDTGIDL